MAAAYVVGPVSGGKISLMKGPTKVMRPPAYLQTRYRVNLRVNLGEFRLPIYHSHPCMVILSYYIRMIVTKEDRPLNYA